MLIFCAAMGFSKEIDLRILIAEHFRNARTGSKIDHLRVSRIKRKNKCQKNSQQNHAGENPFLQAVSSP